MSNGAGVIAEGLGSLTLATEGFGYTPRAVEGMVRPEIQKYIDEVILLHVRNDIANAFAGMRIEYGEEVTVEAILAAVDSTILAQPGMIKRARLEGTSPASLAQEAYKTG